MGDGSLSQQEIDALLEGTDSSDFVEEKDLGATNVISTPGEVVVTPQQKTTVQKQTAQSDFGNLDLLLDVSMNLTVELGRTKIEVKDVLELGSGSIVELDKFTGEPVEVLVNNRLVARGEVIAIDESFGVKVTEIIDPEERLKIGM